MPASRSTRRWCAIGQLSTRRPRGSPRRSLLHAPNRPTAVFAANDLSAHRDARGRGRARARGAAATCRWSASTTSPRPRRSRRRSPRCASRCSASARPPPGCCSRSWPASRSRRRTCCCRRGSCPARPRRAAEIGLTAGHPRDTLSHATICSATPAPLRRSIMAVTPTPADKFTFGLWTIRLDRRRPVRRPDPLPVDTERGRAQARRVRRLRHDASTTTTCSRSSPLTPSARSRSTA